LVGFQNYSVNFAKRVLSSIDPLVGNGHGWAPEDMFAHNASKHGYKTSFSSNLEGYTVQLKVEDSEEYRQVISKLKILLLLYN
jgi:hypothetical protein